MRNKFDLLANHIIGNVDILCISEKKLDTSFRIDQFKIPGFSKPFRRDRDQYGGVHLVFVREDIPAKLSSENFTNSSNAINKFLEIFVFLETLDIFAPRKKKYLRESNMPFMNKSLVNAHRKRTRLRIEQILIESVITSNEISV